MIARPLGGNQRPWPRPGPGLDGMTMALHPDIVGQTARLKRVAHHGKIFWHWGVRRSDKLPYLPAEVSIELTNRCNFKCSFCPQSSPTHFDAVPRTHLTPEQARILLTKLREGGFEHNVIHWTLDGEPFMNKQFGDVVHVSKSLGFTAHHFASNGFFVTRERLNSFPLGPEDRYFIVTDFCADPAYFEKYRGTPGSWQVVRDNLTEVLADDAYRSITFKVTDISSYSISDPAEQAARFAALKAVFPPSPRISFHQRVFHNMTGFAEMTKKSESYNLCPYPWMSMVISANGDVVACCRDLEHKTVVGNLFVQSLQEIWNGPAYRALRKALIEKRPEDMAACKGCDMPHDDSKFSARNMVKSAVHRALLLEKL
jgi:radical SAM protein with 4Fe4S-binding SPASM domain